MEQMEQRIEALEKILTRTKPAIAAAAVELLLAIPDEQKKVRAVVNLLESSPENKFPALQSYLEDYHTFIVESKEKYPQIYAKVSPDLAFLVRYFHLQKEKDAQGVTELLEETENYSIRCTSPEYGKVLLLQGMEVKNRAWVQHGLELLNLQSALSIAEKIQSQDAAGEQDELVYYGLGGILWKFGNPQGKKKGAEYLHKVLEQHPEKAEDLLGILEKNAPALKEAGVGRELYREVIAKVQAAYASEQSWIVDTVKRIMHWDSKMITLIKRVLPVDAEKGAELLEAWATSAKPPRTFREVYRLIEELLPEGALSCVSAEKIMDSALSSENTFESQLETALLFAQNEAKEISQKYYLRSLGLSENQTQLLKIGDHLLREGMLDIAEQYYLKALGTNNPVQIASVHIAEEVGRKLYSAGKKEAAFRWMERTLSLEQTFSRAVSLAEFLSERGESEKAGIFYQQAYALEASNKDCFQVAEKLLKRKEWDLANLFYDLGAQKTSEEERSPAFYAEIGKLFLGNEEAKDIARLYFDLTASSSKSPEVYLQACSSRGKEVKKIDNLVYHIGLKTFNTEQGYEYILSHLKKEQGLEKMRQFIEEFETEQLVISGNKDRIPPNLKEILRKYQSEGVPPLMRNLNPEIRQLFEQLQREQYQPAALPGNAPAPKKIFTQPSEKKGDINPYDKDNAVDRPYEPTPEAVAEPDDDPFGDNNEILEEDVINEYNNPNNLDDNLPARRYRVDEDGNVINPEDAERAARRAEVKRQEENAIDYLLRKKKLE